MGRKNKTCALHQTQLQTVMARPYSSLVTSGAAMRPVSTPLTSRRSCTSSPTFPAFYGKRRDKVPCRLVHHVSNAETDVHRTQSSKFRQQLQWHSRVNTQCVWGRAFLWRSQHAQCQALFQEEEAIWAQIAVSTNGHVSHTDGHMRAMTGEA